MKTLRVALVDEAPPNELDARRELTREFRREFRIEGLLQRPPGPIVYLARDAEERPLALKVAPRVDGGPEDRFHAAADAAAQLAHPHIVPVYRHGATENFLWYAATYVDGQSLATMLQTSGPLELSACLRIFEQVASALDYAHRRGVAHGALTPASIIVDANEWALVDDFATRGLLDSAPGSAGRARGRRLGSGGEAARRTARCRRRGPAGRTRRGRRMARHLVDTCVPGESRTRRERSGARHRGATDRPEREQ